LKFGLKYLLILCLSFYHCQVPKPKALTKWEQFAKLKGIKKRSKSRLVYDEEKDEYLPRFGFKRANDPSRAWVLEHKDGKDDEGTPILAPAMPPAACIMLDPFQHQTYIVHLPAYQPKF
jgi:hypothetical protein